MSNSTANLVMQYAMSELGSSLVVDGVWGPASQAVFNTFAPVKQKAIKQIGSVVLSLQDNGESDLLGTVLNSINLVANELGVNPPDLRTMVQIESNFDPLAVNGPYNGLMQMGKDAWKDASRELVSSGYSPLKNYSAYKFDMIENLRAGVGFMWFNKKAMEERGYIGTFGVVEAYLAHQQGAKGAFEILNSDATGSALYGWRIKKMLNNPPQDSRGPTADATAFVSRWRSIVEERTV
jgi:hypothetical protein